MRIGRKTNFEKEIEEEIPGPADYAHSAGALLIEDPVMRNRLTDEIRHDNFSQERKMK